MNKVKNALSGVAASAFVTASAYIGDALITNAEMNARLDCRKELGGKAVDACLDDTTNAYDFSAALGIIEVGGLVALVGTGYLSYKAIKQSADTAGVLEDIKSVIE